MIEALALCPNERIQTGSGLEGGGQITKINIILLNTYDSIKTYLTISELLEREGGNFKTSTKLPCVRTDLLLSEDGQTR